MQITPRDLRRMLFLMDQDLTVRELRHLLFEIEEQDESMTRNQIAEEIS